MCYNPGLSNNVHYLTMVLALIALCRCGGLSAVIPCLLQRNRPTAGYRVISHCMTATVTEKVRRRLGFFYLDFHHQSAADKATLEGPGAICTEAGAAAQRAQLSPRLHLQLCRCLVSDDTPMHAGWTHALVVLTPDVH